MKRKHKCQCCMFVSTEWLVSLVMRDCSVLQIITEATYWKG